MNQLMDEVSLRVLAPLEPDGLGAEGQTWQQRKSVQTRIAILEAAIDCLQRHGYGRTTTQLIAEMAGISRGAMLHHYATKQDLIASVITSSFSFEAEMRATAPPESTPWVM